MNQLLIDRLYIDSCEKILAVNQRLHSDCTHRKCALLARLTALRLLLQRDQFFDPLLERRQVMAIHISRLWNFDLQLPSERRVISVSDGPKISAEWTLKSVVLVHILHYMVFPKIGNSRWPSVPHGTNFLISVINQMVTWEIRNKWIVITHLLSSLCIWTSCDDTD